MGNPARAMASASARSWAGDGLWVETPGELRTMDAVARMEKCAKASPGPRADTAMARVARLLLCLKAAPVLLSRRIGIGIRVAEPVRSRLLRTGP
jgi:hypothetical protein